MRREEFTTKDTDLRGFCGLKIEKNFKRGLVPSADMTAVRRLGGVCGCFDIVVFVNPLIFHNV